EETTDFTVYLHADDLTLLRECNPSMLNTVPGRQKTRFQTSPEVARGGCMVQTRFGIVDARRETRAELVRQSLAL
ncbi:MAG: flagellar assembly protein FliH, partial [Candidatus Omnitrophica bacterium]|nr:flagellar assembly protein FliH [Candidatus Omnitrophota bacterium]